MKPQSSHLEWIWIHKYQGLDHLSEIQNGIIWIVIQSQSIKHNILALYAIVSLLHMFKDGHSNHRGQKTIVIAISYRLERHCGKPLSLGSEHEMPEMKKKSHIEVMDK